MFDTTTYPKSFPIEKEFTEERLLAIKEALWYAYMANYLAIG